MLRENGWYGLESSDRRVVHSARRSDASHSGRTRPDVVGGREVLRDQLVGLLTLMRRPNVEIRILPFSAGAHAAPPGSFKLFTMPEPYPNIAYTETLAGAIYVEEPKVERFIAAYDRLCEATLDTRKSAELIKAAVKEFS